MEASNLGKESNHSSSSNSSCLKKSTAMEKEEDARIQIQDKFYHGFNFISDRTSISSKDLRVNPSTKSENRVFSCNYCTQKFCNAQALGGHQNGHRRERLMTKQRQRCLDAVALRLRSRALHGMQQVRSTIHVPNVGFPMFPSRFLHQQLGLGRPAAENGGGWRVPTAVDESGGFRYGGGRRQQEFEQLDLSLKL